MRIASFASFVLSASLASGAHADLSDEQQGQANEIYTEHEQDKVRNKEAKESTMAKNNGPSLSSLKPARSLRDPLFKENGQDSDFHPLASVRLPRNNRELNEVIMSPPELMHAPPPGELPPQVIGGDDADPGEYPFMVQPLGPYVCGGSMIAPNMVISAGHCSVAWQVGAQVLINSSQFRVPEAGSVFRTIESIHVHPGFSFPDNDVMFIVLDKPVDIYHSNVQLVDVAVPSHQLAPNQLLTLIGFGRQTGDPGPQPLASTLQEATLRFLDDVTCSGIVSLPFDTLVCAIDDVQPEVQQSCFGDSGGPLLDMSGETPVLAGVVSGGFGYIDGSQNCLRHVPSFYFEPNGAEFNWVVDQVCNLASSVPAWAVPFCPCHDPCDVCNYESIYKGDFYHPFCEGTNAFDPFKFVQCDAWGKCFKRHCGPHTKWCDAYNTCIHANPYKGDTYCPPYSSHYYH